MSRVLAVEDALKHKKQKNIDIHTHTHHGEEDAKLRVHGYDISIGELEVLAAFLLTGVDDSDLLCCHRQHGQLDAVKLVETAPGPRLCQT